MNRMVEAELLPETQHAIQLVGPGQLVHNRSKPIVKPGPHQVLARVEAVGLCFSDLKLLKQFSQHVRKSEIVEGLPHEVLDEISSYVPGNRPTVPGHEVVCRIIAVGDRVSRHCLGERCLVQTDYRALRTANSNAAFGYNFEGGLQEYVLMDERVVIDPETRERFLIPVDEHLSASAIALVEPWACVEDSYANPERRRIKPGGRLLVVADEGHAIEGLAEALGEGKPARIIAACFQRAQREALEALNVEIEYSSDVAALPNEWLDDIVYFGASKPVIENLNDKLAPGGIINLVTGGKQIGAPVSVGIGRIHYGMTRWIGSPGTRAIESYRDIPLTGEIREGEKIAVIGAGGPMGQMHVIRDICSGAQGISVVGTDIDSARLAALLRKAQPLAEAQKVSLRTVNTAKESLTERFSYFALLVPVGSFVADAIKNSVEGSLINVFAGIPAATRHDLDLDAYIARRSFIFGTSGSVIRDMKVVLEKIGTRQLDTNCSVDAIAGMAGAAEGLAAVENRSLAGKIIVYPSLHSLGLIPLVELGQYYPTVSEKLDHGQWTKAAEEELLRVAPRSGVRSSESKIAQDRTGGER